MLPRFEIKNYCDKEKIYTIEYVATGEQKTIPVWEFEDLVKQQLERGIFNSRPMED